MIEPTARPASRTVGGQGGPRGVAPTDAVHASAGTRPCATEEHVAHRRLGPAETWCGTEDQLLIQLRRAAVDGSGVQVGITGLQIRRALDGLADHVVGESWRMLLEYLIDRLREPLGGFVVGHSAGQMCVGPGTFGA